MAETERRDEGVREVVRVARVRRTQGRRGEVAAEILTDFPDRFASGARFLLAKDSETGADPREYFLEDAWFHKGQVILKFAGVENISEAEKLLGSDVLIPRTDRKPLPEGSVYLDDLIGCRVLQERMELGRVADWEDTGGGILLHVDPRDQQSAGEELLIPFVQEICFQVDVASGEIHVRLPEGLLDLNSGSGTTPGKGRRERGKRKE
jgi:16S rRNA processing protein RimM